MALTLAEAAKLSNDVLLAGIIETIIKDSPVLQRPPFIEVVGNGLTYNREATAPSAAFFDVGDTWTESTPTFTQQTVTLKIMGGDAATANSLIAPRPPPQGPPPPPHRQQARPHLRLLPGDRPRRVRPDAPVLRRHRHRRLRLHLGRPDRRHQHRLLHR